MLPGPVGCFWEGPSPAAMLLRMIRMKVLVLVCLVLSLCPRPSCPGPLLYYREGADFALGCFGMGGGVWS